ncbi:hypothetical protein VKT23_000351 [Stygiomarasmius scandens]|uniref:F-box domain-containing protein n=1 Tax=Marasmiellus scandens TaxID=2682957 RepID=A0ABR1K3U1_9AGAR
MDNFPDELLEKIVQYVGHSEPNSFISIKQDRRATTNPDPCLLNLLRVNSRIRRISLPLLFERVQFELYAGQNCILHQSNVLRMQNVLKQNAHLTPFMKQIRIKVISDTLSLRFYWQINANCQLPFILEILSSCPNLQRLELCPQTHQLCASLVAQIPVIEAVNQHPSAKVVYGREFYESILLHPSPISDIPLVSFSRIIVHHWFHNDHDHGANDRCVLALIKQGLCVEEIREPSGTGWWLRETFPGLVRLHGVRGYTIVGESLQVSWHWEWPRLSNLPSLDDFVGRHPSLQAVHFWDAKSRSSVSGAPNNHLIPSWERKFYAEMSPYSLDLKRDAELVRQEDGSWKYHVIGIEFEKSTLHQNNDIETFEGIIQTLSKTSSLTDNLQELRLDFPGFEGYLNTTQVVNVLARNLKKNVSAVDLGSFLTESFLREWEELYGHQVGYLPLVEEVEEAFSTFSTALFRVLPGLEKLSQLFFTIKNVPGANGIMIERFMELAYTFERGKGVTSRHEAVQDT